MSFHEQENCPTTSLDENCKGFDFRLDWKYYIDLRQTYLALELNFVKGRGYETCNTKEIKKEHKGEAAADEETEEEQEAPVISATNENNNLNFQC